MDKPMVLIVDDQPVYARLIATCLRGEGFEFRTAGGGEDAIDLASDLHPDIVLLDVDMPGVDGFAVMAELRERWPVPIILVTGDATQAQRRSGLDRGADDYVTKPFSPRELAARVRAVLRRSHGVVGKAQRRSAADGSRRLKGEQPLTPAHPIRRRTRRILELLVANPNKVIYQDELLAYALGPAFVGDSAQLHEEIRRLRRALDVPAGSEGPIRTVRGIGYAFDPLASDLHRAPRGTSQGRAPAVS